MVRVLAERIIKLHNAEWHPTTSILSTTRPTGDRSLEVKRCETFVRLRVRGDFERTSERGRGRSRKRSRGFAGESGRDFIARFDSPRYAVYGAHGERSRTTTACRSRLLTHPFSQTAPMKALFLQQAENSGSFLRPSGLPTRNLPQSTPSLFQSGWVAAILVSVGHGSNHSRAVPRLV